jgi:hypothetical protein
MLAYWLLFKATGFNAWPYHATAWAIHALNVALLYVLLNRIVKSHFAAAAGALLFSFRANFAEIYWSFGTIYELLACLLMLLVLLIHCRERRSFLSVAAVLVLTILAIKSKEMAITLPPLLFIYDVTEKRSFDRKTVLEFVLLAAVAVWFTALKTSALGSSSPDHPYYMDLRILTLGRGYGWYLDRLYSIRLRWGAWISIAVIASLWMLYKREKRGLFFLAYVFTTLLPVVFLVNHRFEFYWYIPFIGFAGLAAVVVSRLFRKLPASAGLLFFVLLAPMHYWRETRAVSETLAIQRGISAEFETFARQLSELPPPSSGETIYFRYLPKHLTPDALTSMVELVMQRNDLVVKVVEDFPSSCRYCVDFNASR